jgi:hypothetical protein
VDICVFFTGYLWKSFAGTVLVGISWAQSVIPSEIFMFKDYLPYWRVNTNKKPLNSLRIKGIIH